MSDEKNASLQSILLCFKGTRANVTRFVLKNIAFIGFLRFFVKFEPKAVWYQVMYVRTGYMQFVKRNFAQTIACLKKITPNASKVKVTRAVVILVNHLNKHNYKN